LRGLCRFGIDTAGVGVAVNFFGNELILVFGILNKFTGGRRPRKITFGIYPGYPRFFLGGKEFRSFELFTIPQ
jgi:hypothetical protein